MFCRGLLLGFGLGLFGWSCLLGGLGLFGWSCLLGRRFGFLGHLGLGSGRFLGCGRLGLLSGRLGFFGFVCLGLLGLLGFGRLGFFSDLERARDSGSLCVLQGTIFESVFEGDLQS